MKWKWSVECGAVCLISDTIKHFSNENLTRYDDAAAAADEFQQKIYSFGVNKSKDHSNNKKIEPLFVSKTKA